MKVIQAISRRDQVHGHWDEWTQISDVMWQPVLDGRDGPPGQQPIDIVVTDDNLVYRGDARGNSICRIRLPGLEAPVACYTDRPDPGGLAGKTEPFAPDELRRLYLIHADYVAKVPAASQAAPRAGIVLPCRVDQHIRQARDAPVPA